MDLKELVAVGEGHFVTRLEESLQIVSSPRAFLRRVASEPTRKIVLRIATLAAAFAALEMSLVAVIATTAHEWNTLEFLGTSIFEVLFSFALVPTFALVAVAGKYRRPFRTAVVYAVTFRLVFLTVPLILTVFFLWTESYAVALARGVALWAFVLTFLVTFPLSIGTTLRVRMSALLLTIVLFVGTVWVITDLSDLWGPDSSNIAEYSLFYDPIGAEVDSVHLGWKFVGGESALERFTKAWDDIRGARAEGNMLIGKAGLGGSVKYVAEWAKTEATRDSQLQAESTRLKQVEAKSHFATTRRLIQLNLVAIDAARAAGAASLSFNAGPTPERLHEFYKAYLHAMDVQIAGMDGYIAHVRPRRWLANRLLLIDSE